MFATHKFSGSKGGFVGEITTFSNFTILFCRSLGLGDIHGRVITIRNFHVFMLLISFRTSFPRIFYWAVCAYRCPRRTYVTDCSISSFFPSEHSAKNILSCSTTYSSSGFLFYPDDPKHTLRSLEMYTGRFWRRASNWLKMWEGLVAETH